VLTKEGRSNAQSLFGIEKIPSDNHIRDILDNIEPHYLQPLYDRQLKYLEDAGVLDRYRYMQRYPVALDGTQFYSSEKICCTKCLTREYDNTTHYLHQAVTPIIVSPHHKEIIPLMPEFIQNSDGKEKQDCEINASKRWTKGYHLEHNFGHGKNHLSEFLLALNILAFLFHTVLGILDENYAKAKAKVPTKRFFQDMETLTSFIYFLSWDILIAFMARDRDSPMLSISDLMDISKL